MWKVSLLRPPADFKSVFTHIKKTFRRIKSIFRHFDRHLPRAKSLANRLMGYNTLKISLKLPILSRLSRPKIKLIGSVAEVMKWYPYLVEPVKLSDIKWSRRRAVLIVEPRYKMHKINSLERRLTNLPSSSSSLVSRTSNIQNREHCWLK